jgi:hypothetical protein
VDLGDLLCDLAAKDARVRGAAADTLVAAGEPAVAPVLAVLCDESSSVGWVDSATVLTRLGDVAFAPLVAALSTAPTPEVARRAGWAFGHLHGVDPARYVAEFAHPSARVRADSAFVLQRQRAGALPYAPVLIGLLDDPDESVRQRAIWALAEVGPDVLPILRHARRSAGAHRPGALTALAEAGGWAALDARDQALVRRLIAVKRHRETPEPMHLCGGWFALPTDNQAAVLDAFHLRDPFPVTMRLGEAAWTRDQHDWSRGDHTRCARMYVSPALDGWTLVFGHIPEVAHAAEDEALLTDSVRRRCAELSATFGAAHWYGASCGDGWTAWCIAERGELIRYYDVFTPDSAIGPAHPAEEGYALPHTTQFPYDALEGVDTSDKAAVLARYLEAKQRLGVRDRAHATTVAARASVDPSELGPHTRVVGQAVLAATPCREFNPSPRGALAI